MRNAAANNPSFILANDGDGLAWFFGLPLDKWKYDGTWYDTGPEGERDIVIRSVEEQLTSGRRWSINVKHDSQNPKAIGKVEQMRVVTREQLAKRGVRMAYRECILFGGRILDPEYRVAWERGQLRSASPEARPVFEDDQGRQWRWYIAETSFVGIGHFKGQPTGDELTGLQFSEDEMDPKGKDKSKVVGAEGEGQPATGGDLETRLAAVEATLAQALERLGKCEGGMEMGDKAKGTPAAAVNPVQAAELAALEKRIIAMESAKSTEAARVRAESIIASERLQMSPDAKVREGQLKTIIAAQADGDMLNGVLAGWSRVPARTAGERSGSAGAGASPFVGLQFSELPPEEQYRRTVKAQEKMPAGTKYADVLASLAEGEVDHNKYA